MSLVGNLEDLGLGEILQIVSLSRKSGVLSLYSTGREGEIVFRQGQVIRAIIDGRHPHLGQLLLNKRIIEEPTLRQALAIQADEGFRERLGDILAQRFSVRLDLIEEIVRERIESVVYEMFTWDEGSFDFELRDSVDALEEPRHDPVQYLLERGVNPQFLAMEGSRILDEARHRGGAPDEGERAGEISALTDSCDLAFDLMQSGPAPAEAPAGERLAVLVDDDEEVRGALASLLAGWGYTVHDFSRTEDTLIKIDFLYRDGFRPLVLVDLIMPRMDGSGILGGLELIELIKDNFPDLGVLVLADHRTSGAEQKVRDHGYPFMLKPRRGDISDAGAFGSFSERLRSVLIGAGQMVGAAPARETVNLGDELFREIGEDFVPVSVPVGVEPGVSLLRSMLEELNNPSLEGEVILLVLRFAAEFMNRAVVFTIGNNGIMGLGQFGIIDPDGQADARVRDLRIPVDADHLFSRVIETKMALKQSPGATEWNRHLLGQLGGGTPVETFVGPLVSEGKVVALLYGDNLPEPRPIGDTDTLEIFLSQAGLAMEKARLQRKLTERAREGK